MTDDSFGYGYGAVSDQGDDDTGTGGSGNGTSVGGAHAGGSSNGGSGAQGGSNSGGTHASGGDTNMAGAPGFPDIACDGMTCDPMSSVCCKRRSAPSTCEALGTMCSQGATLSCSGSGQCAPGQVCCFHFNSSVCADSCDVGVGSLGNPPTILLCDSDADCADGEICVIAPRGIAYCATTAG